MAKEQILKNAQYRKGLSIAFFNATNNAIEIIKLELENELANGNEDSLSDRIKDWRDWLLEEHKNYYAEVIAKIGVTYNSKETIEKLKTAKTVEELKSMWISLSEDERRDGDIIKEVNKLKYEKDK